MQLYSLLIGTLEEECLGKAARPCSWDLNKNKKATIFLHHRIKHVYRKDLGCCNKNKRMSWMIVCVSAPLGIFVKKEKGMWQTALHVYQMFSDNMYC